MCLYLIVRLSAPDDKDLKRLMLVAFFLGLTQSFIGILSWIVPQVLSPAWVELAGQRTTGSLVNTDVYTITLLFSGLLMLHGALQRNPGLLRSLYVAGFILTLFCVFLSFSRASWLGGILVCLGLLFLYPRFMVRLGLVALPITLILGGGLLAGQFDWARERLSSSESERSALSRLPVFVAAYRMFEAKPVAGWGYANFDRYDRQFQGQVEGLFGDSKDHASHNAYLTIIAEQGLVGISLYLAPVVWWLILSVALLPRMPAQGLWSAKLLIVLWLIVLNQFVVNNFSNLRVVFGLGVWWINLGLIANMLHNHLAAGNHRVPTRARRAVDLPKV